MAGSRDELDYFVVPVPTATAGEGRKASLETTDSSAGSGTLSRRLEEDVDNGVSHCGSVD